jgi:hypothetical protein
MRWRATLLAMLLAPAAAVRAQSTVDSPAVAPPPPTTSLETPAPAPWSRKGFALTAGWGYYEVTHVGVSYRLETAAFALFGGYGAADDADTVTVGASFSHDLFDRVWSLQPGWNLKAIYWTRSDADYDWKNLTLVLGAYLAKDLGRNLRLALDGGVALTGALESERKQDYDFGHPERWNGSVCLEISYRLGGP